MKNQTRWSEEKNRKETKEGHADRLARRRQIVELRAQSAFIERRDGKEFLVLRIPTTWERT